MKVVYRKTIIKDVRKIKNQKTIEKIESIIKIIDNANSLDETKGIKKLKGSTNAFWIRIGDYRLGFYCYDNEIHLVRIVKRNDIYKLFP